MFSLKNKICMNLIAHNDHVMSAADISNCLQLLLCPHSSNRIMRIAKEKEFYFFLCDFFLKVCKINMIAIVLSQEKVTAYDFSSII